MSLLTSLELTFFPFDIKIAQDEGRRFWSKTIEGKGPWVHMIIPTLNCTRVICKCNLYMIFIIILFIKIFSFPVFLLI